MELCDDQTYSFPAEAFALSARTADEMSTHVFGCHESGVDRPVTCAGFLLRGAEHNMAVRMRLANGLVNLDSVHHGGHELHPGYVDMATANGLPRDHESLRDCRESSYERDARTCDCGGELRVIDERDGYRALVCRTCDADFTVQVAPY